MTDPDLTSCLDMIDLTSGQDYRNSSMGWNRDAKLAEMKSPGLRYILVRDDGGAMAAFTSFMPTYEEGQPVLYCYEIHLLDRVRKYDYDLKSPKWLGSFPVVSRLLLINAGTRFSGAVSEGC